MSSPTLAVAGPLLTIFRSGAVTLLVVVDVLSSGVLSVGPTVAVLVTVPVAVGLTTIVNTLVAFGSRLPTAHEITLPVAVQPGSLVTRSTLPGRVSDTVPSADAASPVLLTVSV